MRVSLGIFFVVIATFLASFACAQEAWAPKNGNLRGVEARAMFMNEGDFYIATRKEVYKTGDINKSWESIFYIPSGENEINCFAGTAGSLFIGTRRGLFRSQDYGTSWKNVFRTVVPEKNHILCVEVSRDNPRKVLAGSKTGVFETKDCGNRWKDISGILKDRSVKCLAVNDRIIYAAADTGLYAKHQDREDWERLIVESSPEEEEPPDDGAESDEPAEAIYPINSIAIKDEGLYVGLGKKILYSSDGGSKWRDFSSQGLAGKIVSILPSSKSDKLYCATTKGIFAFDKDRGGWLELYKGLEGNFKTNRIVFGGEDEKSLWALTDKGLYCLEGARYEKDVYLDVEKGLNSFNIICANEPSFRQLQRAAIEFAEVSPEKIRDWRAQARLKALVPKVTFGMDRNSSTSSEIYTSASRDYVIVGPDDVSRNLDMSVSWELGDLVWSDDQTNIDVRSRLMVQLRNDILDDLRRLYYERKRIQLELTTNSDMDVKTQLDRQLRLEELTQGIDDLTGNYFSDHIKKITRAQ